MAKGSSVVSMVGTRTIIWCKSSIFAFEPLNAFYLISNETFENVMTFMVDICCTFAFK